MIITQFSILGISNPSANMFCSMFLQETTSCLICGTLEAYYEVFRLSLLLFCVV